MSTQQPQGQNVLKHFLDAFALLTDTSAGMRFRTDSRRGTRLRLTQTLAAGFALSLEVEAQTAGSARCDAN